MSCGGKMIEKERKKKKNWTCSVQQLKQSGGGRKLVEKRGSTMEEDAKRRVEASSGVNKKS